MTPSEVRIGATIIASGSTGVPGIWISPRIMGDVVDDLRLALLDHVASDPGTQGGPAGKDLLRVFVTGKGRDEAAGGAVDKVDRERVVRDDIGQGVGDRLEDGPAFAVEEEPLGDREQLPLAGQATLERGAAALELLDLAGVDDGDRRLGADDLGKPKSVESNAPRPRRKSSITPSRRSS